MRIGTTGVPSSEISKPVPGMKGFIAPFFVYCPSGNTRTLYPRSIISPAKAKLRRNPLFRGIENTLKKKTTKTYSSQ